MKIRFNSIVICLLLSIASSAVSASTIDFSARSVWRNIVELFTGGGQGKPEALESDIDSTSVQLTGGGQGKPSSSSSNLTGGGQGKPS